MVKVLNGPLVVPVHSQSVYKLEKNLFRKNRTNILKYVFSGNIAGAEVREMSQYADNEEKEKSLHFYTKVNF